MQRDDALLHAGLAAAGALDFLQMPRRHEPPAGPGKTEFLLLVRFETDDEQRPPFGVKLCLEGCGKPVGAQPEAGGHLRLLDDLLVLLAQRRGQFES